MAVETFGKATVFDDDDDEDDLPIVFKRTSTSRQNQLDSAVKHAQPQRLNKLSARQTSDLCSANGQSSNAQKRMTSLPKTSPVKSVVASQKASNSSIQEPSVKSPDTTLKVSDSMDRPKHSINAAVKEENDSVRPTQENSDSEDDKPLSFRLKGNSSQPSKGLVPTMSKNKVKKPPADSDDEINLASRFQIKSASGVSGGKQHGFDEKKPLASKVHQNGSTSRDKLQKPATVSSKRPLANADSHPSSQSSTKKPKLSDLSTPLSTKQVSLKAKQEADDDDDDIPISQRIKKSSTSVNKSSSSKQTVTKVASSSIKKTFKKSKKQVKKSKYVKSTKLLPSAGDGQKKWTTLVHNGVIFPPPYQTHGVKMLYKGKPIDLTPEQEEVCPTSRVAHTNMFLSFSVIFDFLSLCVIYLMYSSCLPMN